MYLFVLVKDEAEDINNKWGKFFFKPIGSTSSSNITGVEHVNPSEEQPIANNNTI